MADAVLQLRDLQIRLLQICQKHKDLKHVGGELPPTRVDPSVRPPAFAKCGVCTSDKRLQLQRNLTFFDKINRLTGSACQVVKSSSRQVVKSSS